MLIAETILAPLRAAPIFHGLTEEQIAAVAAVAERTLYKPGDVIIEAGTTTECGVVIAWGDAVSFDEAGDLVPVPVGSVLSEMAMFVDIETGTKVQARTAVRTLRIYRNDMLDILTADPDMADKLVQCVAGRLRYVVEALSKVEVDFSHALDLAEIRNAVVGSHSIPPRAQDMSLPH